MVGGASTAGGVRPRVIVPRRGRWAQAELARLRELYGRRELAVVARELRRPIESVQRMAQQVFAGELRTGPWTAPEIQRLRECLGCSTPSVIAQVLGRSVDEVQSQIFELGRLQKSGKWTRQEVAELKRVYGTRTDEDLSRIFSRSSESIRAKAETLRLAKDKAFSRRHNSDVVTPMPRWEDHELQLLRELYASTPNLEIARRLGRSVKSVVSKAHNMELKKGALRLQEMGRTNVMLRYKDERAARAGKVLQPQPPRTRADRKVAAEHERDGVAPPRAAEPVAVERAS